MAWGDEYDDSDDEQELQAVVGRNESGGLVIPPTHKSRIDSNGIQIVTSYRQNPSNKNQLMKTVTKIKVDTMKVKEPKDVSQRRRGWKKFGQALLDEKAAVQTTVRSKEDVFLEDPNADTDLQDEDPSSSITGNLNAFWAKQQRRQLERKYDVNPGDADGGADGGGGGGGGAGAAQGAAGGGGGGWTQVVGSGSKASGGAGGPSVGKYVPPSQRGGGAAGGGPGGMGSSAYKPEQRRDDFNTLRVTNLSENTTEADLQELFQRFGRM